MTHHRFSRKTAVYSLFQLPVGLGLPLMLTQMLRPGVHQEYLQITIRDFSIAEDCPPIRAIATPDPTIFMHRIHKFCRPFWDDGVFDGHQYRSLLNISPNFPDDDRHAPVVPGTQIRGRIGKLREKGNRCGGDCPYSSVDKRGSNARSLRDGSPGRGPERISPLINQNEDGEDSCSYPIRRQVLDQGTDKGNENDPCRTANQHNRSQRAQSVQPTHRQNH